MFIKYNAHVLLKPRRYFDDPQEMIPVPWELRHRRTEVIFIAMEQEAAEPVPMTSKPTLVSLTGCWEGESLERAPQI